MTNKRDNFLSSLAGTKNKYKRFSESPLRYPGGKSLAVGHIIERIPENTKEMMSPFVGGASVEIACAKYLDIGVTAYDIFPVLTTYWQQQFNNARGLYSVLSSWKPNAETYNKIKARLRSAWEKKEPLLPVELAAHYFFNFNLSYGPSFLGWQSKIYENEARYKRIIEKVRDFQCGNFAVTCADFAETIPAHDKTFIYADPPYYLDGDSKLFEKGMYPARNKAIHHIGFKHEKLRDLLHSHKGKFILSYNDCSAVREWYKEFNIEEVAWQYTMGQGETRIGKFRKEDGNNHIKQSHELLITKL